MSGKWQRHQSIIESVNEYGEIELSFSLNARTFTSSGTTYAIAYRNLTTNIFGWSKLLSGEAYKLWEEREGFLGQPHRLDHDKFHDRLVISPGEES